MNKLLMTHQISEKAQLRVTLGTGDDGRHYLTIRVYGRTPKGGWFPGARGVTIQPDSLPAFLLAMRELSYCPDANTLDGLNVPDNATRRVCPGDFSPNGANL